MSCLTWPMASNVNTERAPHPYKMFLGGGGLWCGLSKVATAMGRCGFQPVLWRGQTLNPERRKLDAQVEMYVAQPI